MFDIPGFDPKTMSDEELLNRSNELSRKLNWAYRFGSMDAVAQMQRMIAAIDAERRERTFVEQWEMMQQVVPAVIETDPDLREQAQTADKKQQEAKEASTRARPRLGSRRLLTAPSPTPVNVQPLAPGSKPDGSAS